MMYVGLYKTFNVSMCFLSYHRLFSKPQGSAPATLAVQRLCSSVFDVQSTNMSSPLCGTHLCMHFIIGVTMAMINGVLSPPYCWYSTEASGLASWNSSNLTEFIQHFTILSAKSLHAIVLIHVAKVPSPWYHRDICFLHMIV